MTNDTTSVRAAIRDTLHEEMERDESVFLQGIDVAGRGGTFGVLEGLVEEFGEERIRNTPISEVAVIGSALGAAMTGMRPVAEIMYSGFLGVPMDQLLNQVAKLRYMTDGGVSIPLTIRTQNTAGFNAAAQHSQALHHLFMAIPGIKVVAVSTPRDAAGLLRSAIRHDDPVLVFEHAGVYNREGPAAEPGLEIPIGEASVEREGDDVTVIATQMQLWNALDAADELAENGVDVEVVSPRTFDPLDVETLAESVRKTGRAVVVDETPLTGGTQSHLATVLTEEAFFDLDFPVQRVGVENVPVPYSPPLEDEVIPSSDDIVDAVTRLA